MYHSSQISSANRIVLDCGQVGKAVIRPTRNTHLVATNSMLPLPRLLFRCWLGCKQKFKSLKSTRRRKTKLKRIKVLRAPESTGTNLQPLIQLLLLNFAPVLAPGHL